MIKTFKYNPKKENVEDIIKSFCNEIYYKDFVKLEPININVNKVDEIHEGVVLDRKIISPVFQAVVLFKESKLSDERIEEILKDRDKEYDLVIRLNYEDKVVFWTCGEYKDVYKHFTIRRNEWDNKWVCYDNNFKSVMFAEDIMSQYRIDTNPVTFRSELKDKIEQVLNYKTVITEYLK